MQSCIVLWKEEGKVYCRLAIGMQIASQEKSTMADKENIPPCKIQRYLCKSNDKMAREYSEIRSKKGDSFAYCVKCSLDISIGNGRKTDMK